MSDAYVLRVAQNDGKNSDKIRWDSGEMPMHSLRA